MARFRKELNPLFHLRNKPEDEATLSLALIKQARNSGTLNLSGRGLTTGMQIFREQNKFKQELYYNLHYLLNECQLNVS